MKIFMYILLCFLWGSTWIAIKLGLEDAPPFYSSGLRYLVAMLIIYTIVLAKRCPLPKTFISFVRIGFPGLFMFGASYACVYLAEQYINSALTSVLFASFPIFVATLSRWMLKDEKTSKLVWVGLMLGFAGIVLISYDSLQTSGNLFLGTVLALSGSFVAAVGMLIHKRYFSQENIYSTLAVQMTFGGILLLLAAFIFENFSDFHFTALSVGSLLYLAVFGTIIAFLSYYWLLARVKAVTASSIAFITPLVAIFIGVIFFNESMSLLIILGTILILSGVMTVIRR